MTPNHYATLGLSPKSEDVVIRAAYLALMRRYHPDRNPSAEAAAHARAIAAAYFALGDPGRRAEYDRQRAEGAWMTGSEPQRAGLPGGTFAAASVALLLALVSLVIWSPLPLAEKPHLLADVQVRSANGDRIGTPDAESPKPMTRPVLRPNSDSIVPLAAADPATPRSRLRSAGPALEPTPAASPRMAAAAPPQSLAGARPAPRPKATQMAVAKPAASQPAALEAQPSFACSAARTRAQIAVCNSPNLASLDRQQALLFSQSWGRADSARRAQLLDTRDRFIARRDACRSNACTSGAYLARMREVSGIMIGKQPPPR